MAPYSVIEESKNIRREAYKTLKDCREKVGDVEFLQIKLNLCEIHMEVV